MSDQHHTGAPGSQGGGYGESGGGESGGGESGGIESTGVESAGVESAGVESAGAHRAPPGGEVERRYANPGLTPHVHRRSDIDPKAAKRREREVATLFGLSTLATVLFIVGYFAVKLEGTEGQQMLDRVSLSTKLLGVGMGLALFFIGAGAIHWAKTLMPDDEIIAERKPMRSTDDNRSAALASMKEGAAGAAIGRRKLIRTSLLGAMAPLGLMAIIPLRDLGTLPGAKLTKTAWRAGKRLVTDPTNQPIKASDVPVGGVIHVMPEGIDELPEALNEKAKATVLVMRLEPRDLHPSKDREGWAYEGIVAYSKVCTHVGCPVGLYEQQTRHLLCPCHQSTFDVTDECKVIFGPAARPLPQLPIGVDSEGYLIATDDFAEPVGPSYWERG